MQAIREIHTVKNGTVNLTLPKAFWDSEVEIIVLSTEKPKTYTEETDELYGCLNQYASPERRAQEDNAWKAAIEEKYRAD